MSIRRFGFVDLTDVSRASSSPEKILLWKTDSLRQTVLGTSSFPFLYHPSAAPPRPSTSTAAKPCYLLDAHARSFVPLKIRNDLHGFTAVYASENFFPFTESSKAGVFSAKGLIRPIMSLVR